MITLKKGSRGEEVKLLQRKLNLIVDGIFGSITDEAVRQFQKEENLKVDGIVGSETWSKLNLIPPGCIRHIDEIIIHCTATKESQKNITVKDVDAWHRQRGFNGIGYHYLILPDGTVQKGRDLNTVGAHCLSHNKNSIGICYVGGLDDNGKPKDTRTEAQKRALKSIVNEMYILFPNATVHGHNEFANKACPCFDVAKEFSEINNRK